MKSLQVLCLIFGCLAVLPNFGFGQEDAADLTVEGEQKYTCANVRCNSAEGYYCEDTLEGPKCVKREDPDKITCRQILCKPGYRCVEGKCDEDATCVKYREYPDGPSCADVICPMRLKCVDGNENQLAKCVPVQNGPDNPWELTCATYCCEPGYTCIETSDGPKCIPKLPDCDTCATLTCKKGKICVEGHKNQKAKCIPIKHWHGPGHPPKLTCATYDCCPGFKCIETPKGPDCVPIIILTEGPSCADVKCPLGLKCVDGKEKNPAKCLPNPHDPPPKLTCATYCCKAGYTCIETDDGPFCVKNLPEPPKATCREVHCAKGWKCVESDCECEHAHCVPDVCEEYPDDPLCAAVTCPEGWRCVKGKCIPPRKPSCKLVDCPDRHRCVEGRKGPKCVPIDNGNGFDCRLARCVAGFTCVQDVGCVKNNPKINCEMIRCPKHHTCLDFIGCVPNKGGEPTISCKVITCEDGYNCVEGEGCVVYKGR